MPKPFGAESGGVGTGKILRLNPLGLSKILYLDPLGPSKVVRHRKDLVPKPFGAE